MVAFRELLALGTRRIRGARAFAHGDRGDQFIDKHRKFSQVFIKRPAHMPSKASTQWTGGSVKLDTADKKRLLQRPQQQHNLSMTPNRCVLLTAPPNRGKSSLCLQIAARSAPFHKVFVLHGTPGTLEYECIDHVTSRRHWATPLKYHKRRSSVRGFQFRRVGRAQALRLV